MQKTLNRTSAGITGSRPAKVLQFGEGNFLRAFVDWIIEEMNEKTGFNASIDIVQPINAGLADLINQQEGLYHLLLNGIKNGTPSKETKLIKCVNGALNPYEDYKAFLQLGENPYLEFVVSNTTEAGITFDPQDADYDRLPNSFPGKLTALLFHRFSTFNGAPDKGLTFLPCELIDKNGDVLKSTILQYIHHWKMPDGFRSWIVNNCIFCNTLVDRIVPGFPKETIKEIQEELGFADNLVVTAEPFHLWVIEAPEKVRDAFPADKAGLQVKFVKDQTPYRTRKVRILNGAHTTLVPVAYLEGLRIVKDAVENEKSGAFIKKAIYEEIIPTLDLPDEELKQFADDVIERFRNPYIKHELISIALNSVSKYKVRVLPSVLEYYKRKAALPENLLYSLAALIVFYRGNWRGESIPLNDTAPVLEFFSKAWSSNDPEKVVKETLANKEFWDQDLNEVPGLFTQVIAHAKTILKEAGLATVKASY